jgi:hypothetical protein
MNMRAANVNVVKRTEVARGGVSHQARHCECEEESYGGKEKPSPGPIAYMLMKKLTDAGMVQK